MMRCVPAVPCCHASPHAYETHKTHTAAEIQWCFLLSRKSYTHLSRRNKCLALWIAAHPWILRVMFGKSQDWRITPRFHTTRVVFCHDRKERFESRRTRAGTIHRSRFALSIVVNKLNAHEYREQGRSLSKKPCSYSRSGCHMVKQFNAAALVWSQYNLRYRIALSLR